MPSKNDLSAFKNAPKQQILPSNDGVVETKPKTKPITKKQAVGRPPVQNKRSYKVVLSLTEGERTKLEKKAGLANNATVLYDHLVKTGFFN